MTQTTTIDLKILIISADGKEAGLPAIAQTLDYLGAPYTIYVAARRPGGLARALLADGNHGFYQGVILATGAVARRDGTNYVSALSAEEWEALRDYEAAFGVRRVGWYTVPAPEYGFQPPRGAANTADAPLLAHVTAAGRAVFPHLSEASPLEIRAAHTYLARPLDDSAVSPLLVDEQGHALTVACIHPDGRETVAVTFDGNADLLHTLALANDLIAWVARGLYVGERRVYLGAQVDDLYLDGHTWPVGTPCGTNPFETGATYRLTAHDLRTALAWQEERQRNPVTERLRLSFGFNGAGSAGAFTPDTLTPAVDEYQAAFAWINHTYDHVDLDQVDYDRAHTTVQRNNDLARGFDTYSARNLITPNLSGLTNPQALQAAYDTGVRYVVCDASRPGYNNPTPNVGIYNASQHEILMIPRHPTNLYYNVSTPQEWLAEDNCIYPAGTYGHVDTYADLLRRESRAILLYLLKGDMDPIMFHQPNLRAYDGIHSLLTDLLDRVLAQYIRLSTVPILSLTMDALGQRMARRMRYSASGVRASVARDAEGRWQSLTLHARHAAIVPVTGLACDGSEMYGGYPIAYVQLGPDEFTTFTLQGTSASARAEGPRVALR